MSEEGNKIKSLILQNEQKSNTRLDALEQNLAHLQNQIRQFEKQQQVASQRSYNLEVEVDNLKTETNYLKRPKIG